MKHLYTLFIFMLLVACGDTNKEEQTEEIQKISDELIISKEQFEGEKMVLGDLFEHDFNTMVKVNGLIEVPTQNESSVSTFVGGYVTKNPLLIGDEVKKGQFLITLESTEYVEIQQRYLEVAQQLNFLKSEFTRQKILFAENISSEKNFLKAESDYKSNLAHYNGLKKKLQMLNINPISVENGSITSTINIYAPIAGYVTKVNVSNGTYVSPADIIMEIIDTAHIHLELSVLTTIDPVNRRVVVHAHIENEDTAFIVGMFAEADIIVSSSNAMALSKSAVIQIENDYFALVLESENPNEYHFTKVKLDIGLQTEEFVEVLNAASLKNKKIVVDGTYMLLNEGGEGGHSH